MIHSQRYRTKVTACLVLFLAGFTHTSFANHQTPDFFTEFNDASELIDFQRQDGEGIGGVAWLDYDNDNDLDLFLTNDIGGPNALFRNDGDGSFTDVSMASGIATSTGHSGVVVGDIDNDGYPDIFLSGAGKFTGPVQSPTRLFHNKGDGTFEDITETAGVPGGETHLSAAFGDINKDGYIDLFITSPGHLGAIFPPAEQHTDRLYLNNGDLTFTDITESAGVLGGLGSCVVSFTDYNQDGWLDLLVGICNDVNFLPVPFHLYHNNGDNTFTDAAATAGLDIGGYWMAIAPGDVNNDGHIDFFATNFGPIGMGQPAPHALFKNNGDGTFSDITSEQMAVQPFSWGASMVDFNNDGYLDLFYGGNMPSMGVIDNSGYLFFNQGSENFVLSNENLNIDLTSKYVSGIAQADYDNDGFADIAIMTSPYRLHNPATNTITPVPGGQPVLLRNRGNNNRSVTIKLVGKQSNQMAIGARIELYAGTQRQVREVYAGSSFASSESPWPSFGIGKHKYAIVNVKWPSGLSEWFPPIKSDRLTTLVEGSGLAYRHVPRGIGVSIDNMPSRSLDYDKIRSRLRQMGANRCRGMSVGIGRGGCLVN